MFTVENVPNFRGGSDNFEFGQTVIRTTAPHHTVVNIGSGESTSSASGQSSSNMNATDRNRCVHCTLY